MKESPDIGKLNDVLRTSPLVAGGFMGDDPRSVSEVIEADAAELFRLGVSARDLAIKMEEITDRAGEELGAWARLDDRREAKTDEARGWTPCPWPHGGAFRKRVTTLRLRDSGRTVQWSDLNIHFIAAHGFFEGKGSSFRTEPADLAAALF
jgi:hypothetical protein